MLTTDRPSQTVYVSLDLFPLPVIQVAVYTLTWMAEFDLKEADGDLVAITVWSLEADESALSAAVQRLERELTAALFQRQAHQDARPIRHLFALAAHEMELPEVEIVAALTRLVDEPVLWTAEPTRPWFEFFEWNEGGTGLCRFAADCEPIRVIRALSRLHDQVEATILGRQPEGGLVVRLRPRTVARPESIEPALRQLLAQCGEGGLPAVYPPVHALERSYAPRAAI